VKFMAVSLAIAMTCGLWSSPAKGHATAQANGDTNAGGVARTTKAVNYRRADGSMKIDLQGTELTRGASAEAKVESKNNRMEIEVKLTGVEDATKFGLEYLTYVFWAVSPQGRAENLGEVVVKNGAGHVKAITDMQTFGMIVTAEPYFAVTQPGNMVVLENTLPVNGSKVENIDATYELLGRGVYSSSNTKIESAIFGIDPKTPRELFQARNSVRIARNAGANQFAASTLAKAEQQLTAAEDAYRGPTSNLQVRLPPQENPARNLNGVRKAVG
jgi:hypothetical protein